MECSVTPCSALLRPAARAQMIGGDSFASRGDVVSCWCTVTICKKSPERAAVAITAAKCQKIVALHHAVLAVADFAMLFRILRRCLGALESLVFYVKKSFQTV